MNQFSFSISKLLVNLSNQPNKQEYISLPDEDIRGTTIRLEPAVRKFCEDQAGKLGVSMQAFITMILNGVMLESTNPAKLIMQLMYERFFEVFKEHNIAITDIPSTLSKFNLTLSILADHDKLIDRLDENIILYLSKKFNVNSDWLKGISHSKGL